VGWDATQNGNLAEQLQEPSLMGAFEGAGVTVLGKGVEFHNQNPWSDGNEGGAFPTGTTLLSGVGRVPTALPTGDANPLCHLVTYSATGAVTITNQVNPYPSNFTCNPSSIDGLTITNSSQGGGGIFAHGWAHHLQIANDRVYNNSGTLTGGISVGQGEFPTPYLTGSATNAAPGSCSNGSGLTTNEHEPYCLQLQVNVHNNFVTNNSSLGDELFSGTLSGGGGVTFCTGNDYYSFNYNWVCGNLSSGEGGGLVHLGEIQNGDIEHNTIALNQSNNPTIATNGGGIQIMGTPDTDPICGTQIDTDCPPGLSDGTGRGLVINANLIQANMAESGSGGGIRLQQVNGTDVSTFPNTSRGGCGFNCWNGVTITNNIIANNVAGWDGAGISLQDSLNVSIINNTIASNDTLASSGVLTQSIGNPQSSSPAGNCVNTAGTASCPQSAGVTSTQDSTLLTTTFTGLTIACPFGNACTAISNPLLQNNLITQNRSFNIGIGNLGQGNLNQQKLVSLFNAFSETAAPVQATSGACTAGVSYWDIGVRGDTGPGNHTGGTLNPMYSVMSSVAGYSSTNHTSTIGFVSEYCNGSRVPPECTVADGCGGPSGYGVPPGIVDASTPNPVFSLTPSATVDEGNNWINVSWGPLSLSNDAVTGGTAGHYGGGLLFGNYAPTATFDGTPAGIPISVSHPATDFFGNLRPEPTETGRNAQFDPGAVEVGSSAPVAVLSVTPTSLTYNAAVGYSSAAQTLTLHNTGTAAAIGIDPVFSSTLFTEAANSTCTATLAAGANCTINVVFTPTALGAATGTLTIYANVAVTGSPVALSGTGVAPVLAATLTPTTWTIAQAANCPGTTLLQVLACTFDPAQTFTLTNTGNVPLTGITQGTLSGANTADFLAVRLLSTCGPATGGQLVATTTLAPGATCTTLVQFKPLTAEALGTKTVTLSVTDLAGTQAAALTGTEAAPTLTSIVPTSGVRGSTAPATLTGTFLDSATAVTVSGTGVTCTIAPAGQSSLTTLTANCVITPGAALGARTVSVTTRTGTSNTVAFTVTGATVTFAGPVPALTTTTANTTTKNGVITVSNAAAASAPLTLTANPTIAKVGGAGGTFSIVAGGTCVSGAVVNPGSNCTISVQYVPGTSTTNVTANVTITGSGLAAATLVDNIPAN